MDILPYPVGLLIGLFPVIVDLGGRPEPAELLLDGRPACTILARAPACTVDLGPDPVVHLLDLVRKDKAGHVTESVKRWVNKPGVEAEVHALGRCEKKTSSCEFTMTWAHPARLDPASLTVALDGVIVARKVTPIVRVPFPRCSTPQVVTADATFPDGRRATFTRLLQGSYPEKAEASLQAIPIAVQPGVPEEEIAALLREAGWPVRAVEQGDFEIEAGDVFTVAIDPGLPQTIYAGTRNGLQVSRDGGDHWNPLRTGAEPAEVYSIAFHPGGREIFFGSGGAIAHSIAGGESWALAPTLAVFSILFDSKDPKMAFAATRGGVFRTADGGTRWIPSEAGMEKTFALSLAADPRDPGVFYAATAGSGVFKSTDKGQSWKLAGRELERTVVRCVATDTAQGESVYAGTDGGVFVSADRGKTWQRRSSGLPRAVVYALAPDPADPSRVFAGTAAGVFESRDGAKSWNRMIGSDADVQVTSLALDAPGGRLYAGTLGRGVLVLGTR